MKLIAKHSKLICKHRVWAHNWLKTLLLLTVVVSSTNTYSSAIFDGSNANLWLFDNNGNVSSYSYTDWIDSYSTDIYALGANQSALVNTVPNSSTPMTATLAPVSLIGLGQADFVIGQATGIKPLLVSPSGGAYSETIEVVFRVDASRYNSLNNLTLSVYLNNELTRLIRFSDQSEKEDGYFVSRLHLVRDGDTQVRATLSAINGRDTEIIEQVSQNFSILSDHPDGERRDTDLDGLPDIIELELGLDPNQDDWRSDKNRDGWGDFDQWLRSESSDKTEIPADSDQDGWADIDEQWRGTNPFDEVTALVEANANANIPAAGSEEYRNLLLRYKDRPTVSRLYEVEREWTLTKGSEPYNYPAWNGRTNAYSLLGQMLFSVDQLLTASELALANVPDEQISDRLKLDTYKSNLSNQQVKLRVPASSGQAADIVADQALNDGTRKRYHYRAYQAPVSDLTPDTFSTDQEWSTAEEWKTLYLSHLQQGLVIETEQAITFRDSIQIDAFFALLGSEIRLNSKDQNPNFAYLTPTSYGPDSFDTIKALHTSLANRENRSFDQIIPDISTMLQTPNLGSVIVDKLVDDFNGLDTQTDSAFWMQQQIAAHENLPYWLRFTLFDSGLAELNGDVLLANPATDVDIDNLSNGFEINQPYIQMTFPWDIDTDQDLVADNNDACPTSNANLCTNTQSLLINTAMATDETVDGAPKQLLVSFQLNGLAKQDVSFSYNVSSGPSNSATEGEDYEPQQGELSIKKGEQIVTIVIPIYDNEGAETTETFFVSISDIQNANSDQASVVIAINEDEVSSVLIAGQLSQIPITGLSYRTPTHSGITEDAGRFYYRAGERVSFSLGATEIGSAAGAPLVTLFDLFGIPDFYTHSRDIDIQLSGNSLSNFNGLLNAVTLLHNLDSDGFTGNGISISPALLSAADNIEIDVRAIPDTNFFSNRGFRDLIQAGFDTAAIPSIWRFKPRWQAMADLYIAAEVFWPAKVGSLSINRGTPNQRYITSLFYDAYGNLTGSDSYTLNTDTNSETRSPTYFNYTFDSVGNQLTYSTYNRADDSLQRQTVNAYNKFGNRIYSGSDNNGDGIVDSSGQYEFDNYNILRRQTRDNDNDGVPDYIQTVTEIDGNTSYTSRRTTDSDGDGSPNQIEDTEIEKTTNRQLFVGRDSEADGLYNQAYYFTFEDLPDGGYIKTTRSDTDNDQVINSIQVDRYNSADKLVLSERDTNADEVIDQTTEYQYNSDQQTIYYRSYRVASDILNESRWVYNADGKQIKKTDYLNSVATRIQDLEYDDNGYQSAERNDYDADGDYDVQYEYENDASGNRVVQRYDTDGDGVFESSNRTTRDDDNLPILFQRFDVNGELTRETTYTYTSFKQLSSQNSRYITEEGDETTVNETTYQTGDQSQNFSNDTLTYAAWKDLVN